MIRKKSRIPGRRCPGMKRSPMRRPSSSASGQIWPWRGVGGITSSRCTNEETYLVRSWCARRVRQQQRGHLRARLPLAYRLWLEDNSGRVGRRSGLRFGQKHHRRHRPTRPTTSVLLPDEATVTCGRKLIVVDPRQIDLVRMPTWRPTTTSSCCRGPTSR
jgi:hypothetical protein